MQRIGEFLRAAMREQKMRQSVVAGQMGKTPTAFRVRLTRGKFSRTEIQFLIKLLKLNATPEEILEKYEFEHGRFMVEAPQRDSRIRGDLGNVWSCIQAADQMACRDEVRGQTMMAVFEQIIRHMTPMGLQIIATQTVTPIEMEATGRGSRWRQAMLSSLRQGATLVYIRPSATKLNAFSAWGFQQTIPMDEAKGQYEAFCTSLVEALAAEDKSRRNVKKMRSLVMSRVAQIYCDEFPYFVPGFTFGLVHEADENRLTVRRLGVRMPDSISFPWISSEVHVFRYVSASRRVIAANFDTLEKKGNLTEEEKAEKSVCKLAVRFLEEHFGLTSS